MPAPILSMPRSLECREGFECPLAPNESIVARYGIRFAPDGTTIADTIRLTDDLDLPEAFKPYTFVCGFTGGTIRGIYPEGS